MFFIVEGVCSTYSCFTGPPTYTNIWQMRVLLSADGNVLLVCSYRQAADSKQRVSRHKRNIHTAGRAITELTNRQKEDIHKTYGQPREYK